MSSRLTKYFDADGTFLGLFGGLGSANGQMNGPRGISVAGDSTIYVADSGNNRVQVFCMAPG
jgi:DNA-binding beta-propeller fold protein YncE